jgi:hypothetical protein
MTSSLINQSLLTLLVALTSVPSLFTPRVAIAAQDHTAIRDSQLQNTVDNPFGGEVSGITHLNMGNLIGHNFGIPFEISSEPRNSRRDGTRKPRNPRRDGIREPQKPLPGSNSVPPQPVPDGLLVSPQPLPGSNSVPSQPVPMGGGIQVMPQPTFVQCRTRGC